MIRADLGGSDSADVVNAGIPYQPVNVVAVSDSATCQAVLNTFNATLAPDEAGKQLTSGFVLSVDRAYALYFPPASDGRSSAVYFDSTFAYRFALTAR